MDRPEHADDRIKIRPDLEAGSSKGGEETDIVVAEADFEALGVGRCQAPLDGRCASRPSLGSIWAAVAPDRSAPAQPIERSSRNSNMILSASPDLASAQPNPPGCHIDGQAVLQNSQRRSELGVHAKLDALADGLADLMEHFLPTEGDQEEDLRLDVADLKRAVGLGE
jgi:hypothetical protein